VLTEAQNTTEADTDDNADLPIQAKKSEKLQNDVHASIS